MSRGLEAIYRDPLCRFYTEASVSTILVDLLSDRAPNRVLDLASGAGSLSEAVGKRWAAGELITVDIDPSRAPNSSVINRRHVIADALDPTLPKIVGAEDNGFDLALCNPPFRLPAWRPAFEKILEEAGFARAFTHRIHIGIDALFVAQNLRLARDGGEIGLIVPDGLVTGRRTEGFRAAMLTSNNVKTVVQLPRRAFKRTDARAFIVVLEKGLPSGPSVALRRLSPDGNLSHPIWVPKVAAERRMDFDFHVGGTDANQPTLLELGAEVVRGNVENGAIRKGSTPFFHTTDFPAAAERTDHKLAGQLEGFEASKLVWAGPGDILIARVHRSLHRKVCGITAGHAALTSCVFRLRLPASQRDKVLSALLSEAGAQRLESTARGVGPRMLAKSDLLAMPIPW